MKTRARAALCGLLLALTGPAGADPRPLAPPVWAPQADGRATGLQDLRGQVVLVDFWASWCAPCLQSLPELESWQRELRDRGFTVLAVNVDTERAKALAFLKRKPVSYPVVYDPQGRWPEQYDVGGMPASYLIDREGRLHASFSGYSEKDLPRIRQQVEALLGAGGETR